jgi:hypothetical protein
MATHDTIPDDIKVWTEYWYAFMLKLQSKDQ